MAPRSWWPPNGVGKTSLVYGLAWGVFGQHTGIVPKDCVRAGAVTAEVQVEFELPDGRQVNISRVAKRRGTATATYEMDGARLDESSAVAEMEKAFGIELPVASRLSMMLGGGHIAASTALNLEGHLHEAFGVAHLLNATEVAQSVAKEAEKARVAIRSSTKQRTENRTALESEIAQLEEDIAHLSQRGVVLGQVRDAARVKRSLVERHIALAGQWERYEQQRSDLIGVIDGLLGRPVGLADNEAISTALQTELGKSERAIAEMTEAAIAARSVAVAADQAASVLEGDDGVCPTCMRPLPPGQRTSAISSHTARREDAQSEANRVEDARGAAQTHAQVVSRLLAQLDALQLPTIETETSDVPSRAEADAINEQATSALDIHNQHVGGMQSRLDSLRAQIASDDQIREEERNLRLAYRREAAALAGAKVLGEAAKKVIESRIEPMASEVRERWKHLFTSNGLTFASDGSITRLRGGEELGWDTLSGGERTWARIVTHLIVLSTTTSLPFAWFDEPLEHLDPHLRHAVAATLATATVGDSPRQLLVTTYEHGIAHQLANHTDVARIIAIRESGASLQPA